MDPLEQFVVDIAAMCLNGECQTHEDECELARPDCVEQRWDHDQAHQELMGLIVQAREILQDMNR